MLFTYETTTQADYDDRVFQEACKSGFFKVFRGGLRGQPREVKHFRFFTDACIDAYDDPRALLYAVTAADAATCLVRSLWMHYLEIYKQI